MEGDVYAGKMRARALMYREAIRGQALLMNRKALKVKVEIVIGPNTDDAA